MRLMRLKDKLGNRSNATAEVEFDQAAAYLIGEPGRGVQTIIDMVTLTRLDCGIASAGLMRIALAEAVHHARHRKAFGLMLIDQPLMTRVIADMALDAVAAAALVFRLAESYDRAANNPGEAAFARLMTPAVKYWVSKMAPALIAEAMECLGGNGYIEESKLPRLYREAPVNAIWEGPGNIMALDVMRVLRKSSEPLEAVLANVEDALGGSAKSTLNVLRAATAVALADEGSARILTEQLAMTVAAASLRRRFPSVIADAFIETRLGKPWRSTYGMLDSRFDSRGLHQLHLPAGVRRANATVTGSNRAGTRLCTERRRSLPQFTLSFRARCSAKRCTADTEPRGSNSLLRGESALEVPGQQRTTACCAAPGTTVVVHVVSRHAVLLPALASEPGVMRPLSRPFPHFSSLVKHEGWRALDERQSGSPNKGARRSARRGDFGPPDIRAPDGRRTGPCGLIRPDHPSPPRARDQPGARFGISPPPLRSARDSRS